MSGAAVRAEAFTAAASAAVTEWVGVSGAPVRAEEDCTDGDHLPLHPLRRSQPFRRIRLKGWLYVDKTRFLRRLEDEATPS